VMVYLTEFPSQTAFCESSIMKRYGDEVTNAGEGLRWFNQSNKTCLRFFLQQEKA